MNNTTSPNPPKPNLSPLDLSLVTIFFTSVFLIILSALILTSTRASADSQAASRATVRVTSSCQLSQTVNTAHEADVVVSTFQGNIGKTTFSVICNDANGYDIYAVGYTNTEFGRNDLLGRNTGRTILTGTAQSGDISNWSMKLSPVASAVAPTITTGYDNYHAVPDDYTKVASYADSTMDNPSGSQFETTYGAYVASAQPADYYDGKIRYTLVHPSDASSAPCTATYTINYNNNGGSGTMDSQTACMDRNIALLPNGFTPPTPVEENQFVVWNTESDGSGYTYYANQSIANLASASGSITLYAQWAPHYIQDLTRNMCQIVASERPLTVYDKRDGNDYTVRYLQGACWMTQNLRITGTVNERDSNFSTYSNVNVCEGDLTSGGAWSEPRCHDSGNTTNGVWYNYAATSAKTILSNSNTTEATEDICPAGWHLPNYDTSKPAGSIDSMAGVDSATVTAFSPVTGGYYNTGGSLSDTGVGNWWSSTTHGSQYRNRLYLSGSLSTGYIYRSCGLYIRCVR